MKLHCFCATSLEIWARVLSTWLLTIIDLVSNQVPKENWTKAVSETTSFLSGKIGTLLQPRLEGISVELK
jgi:hypothetical protein